jgi:hypothetical protein
VLRRGGTAAVGDAASNCLIGLVSLTKQMLSSVRDDCEIPSSSPYRIGW